MGSGLDYQAICLRGFKTFRLGNHTWLLLASGVILTFHWICFFKAINHLSLSDAVFISYIEPVSTIFYGWFLLSETPGWQDLLGGLLIVVAGLVIFLRPSSGVEIEPLL